ncbi:MAG: porin [Phycisphaerales bacterium]
MSFTKFALAAVLAVGSSAFAADAPVDQQIQDMRQQLQAQRQQIQSQQSEISQLRADQGQTWLTTARAEQVKTLVREVLSDADTRASLMDSAITAGHNGKNFFLASEDGNFLLTVDGQLQIRYIWNHIRDTGTRNDQEGFQMRRAKIGFYGHVYDPKLTYGLRIVAANDSDFGVGGTMTLEDAWAAYDVADGWNVKGGQFKGPFLREEAVDSRYQLAVERSLVADLFTVDYTQGVQVSYTADQFRVLAMVHDGSGAANSDYTSTEAEIAFAGRVEFLAMGTWDQFKDFTTFTGDQMGLLLGAAIDYENGEGETGATPGDVLKWTVDASFEAPDAYGFNAFAAVIGSHPQHREALTGTANEPDQFAVVVQAGVFVVPDKFDVFGRYEYIDLDGNTLSSFSALSAAADDPVNILTFGGNYYMHKHGAKFTLDVVWMLDNSTGISTNTGAGLVSTTKDDQVSIRGQFQLLF